MQLHDLTPAPGSTKNRKRVGRDPSFRASATPVVSSTPLSTSSVSSVSSRTAL